MANKIRFYRGKRYGGSRGHRLTGHSGLDHLMKKTLAAGQIKGIARKVERMSAVDAIISIGGGGLAGHMVGGAVADGLGVAPGTGGHNLIKYGSTIAGSVIGINLMS